MCGCKVPELHNKVIHQPCSLVSSVLCDSATKCRNANTNINRTAYMVSEVGLQNSTPQPPVFQIQIQISVKQWAIIEEIDALNLASQLPNFTLELHGDMKANWENFCETFESYVTLMGYRPKYTAKEMAALKYALPKEARVVLKTASNGSRMRINKTLPIHSKK